MLTLRCVVLIVEDYEVLCDYPYKQVQQSIQCCQLRPVWWSLVQVLVYCELSDPVKSSNVACLSLDVFWC